MSDWLGRSAKPVTDWVEDVEEAEGLEKFNLDRGEFDHKENDRPSRPTSRDSRDSQGSKLSKGSRNSGDKLARKLGDYSANPRLCSSRQGTPICAAISAMRLWRRKNWRGQRRGQSRGRN